MVKTTLKWADKLNALAAHAGTLTKGNIPSKSIEDYNRTMNVNATGAFLTEQATLPFLMNTAGSLIFTCSTVALSGMRGVAADFAEMGVRVNAVDPSAVRTFLSESQFSALLLIKRRSRHAYPK